MYHPDGIEVYLKLDGQENRNTKLAEFTLPEDQTREDDKQIRRCMVLAQHDNLKIVVRLSPTFYMYSASALLVRRQLDIMPLHNRLYHAINIFERSRAYDQYASRKILQYDPVIGRWKSLRLAMPRAIQALQGQYDDRRYTVPLREVGCAPEGSIVVAVARGKADWLDSRDAGTSQADSLSGPNDHTEIRKHSIRTGKPIASRNGRWYFFQFCYRSEACIRARYLASVAEKGSSIENIGIDLISVVEDREYVRVREEDKARREKMSEDYKKAQDRLAQEAKDPSQNEIQTGGTQSSMLKERPRKREMRAPEFCDCGEHSRTYPTQAGRSRFRIRLAPLAARKDPQHTARSVDASNSKDKVATPQATHCGRCKKLKVPKSRRPAFLKKWHQDNSRSSEDNDGDDEEVPPRPVPDMKDQAQDGVHGNEEIAADGSTIEGRSRVDEPQPSMESSATAIAFQSSGEVPGTTAIEATQVTITPSSAASPQTKTTNEQASAAAPSAPPESLSTGVSSPQAIAYSSEDPAISLEGGAQISEREDMSKRPAEEPVEDRPAKHQRIDIDLTGDDVAMVKTEHKAEGKGKNMLKTQEINDKEELEARLQDIRMRKEELQLKREEAEVQRQLRELEKRAGRPTRESGGIIKIED